jgi:hypothetical protein
MNPIIYQYKETPDYDGRNTLTLGDDKYCLYFSFNINEIFLLRAPKRGRFHSSIRAILQENYA